MIPVYPHKDFTPRRREHWIPSMVLIQKQHVEAPMAPSTEKKEKEGASRSLEEICAANVLMSLSPPKSTAAPSKESTMGCFRPTEQPPLLATPVSPQLSSTVSVSSLKENHATPSSGSNWQKYAILSSSSSAEYESTGSLSCIEQTSSGYNSDTTAPTHDASFAYNSRQESHQVPSVASVPSTWYPGSTSLSLMEDDDFLSPLHCFMRRYCVEAFSASPEDVATPRYGKSHGVRVVVGQVGIRCLYCKQRPVGRRPERAVCFPSSLRNIYHSIETWQRRHSLVCTDISPWVKKSMIELMESSKSRAGGRRQYWEDSAMRLGMVDTAHGVRFSRPPGDLGAIISPATSSIIVRQPASPAVQDLVLLHNDEQLPEPIIREQDRQLVTDFLFLLMEQMQTCQFTEEDRSGGRSKIKDNEVGFPGMQCRHCRGKAGLGRYFPSSVEALALANSDRNIYNHVQKCRRCPPQIKADLVRLSKAQTQCKNKRGLRKLFFKRVWGRMHGQSNPISS